MQSRLDMSHISLISSFARSMSTPLVFGDSHVDFHWEEVSAIIKPLVY
jgi:hypothetical protein